MVLYYLLWNYHSRRDATTVGATALRDVTPRIVERKIYGDFNRAQKIDISPITLPAGLPVLGEIQPDIFFLLGYPKPKSPVNRECD